MLFPIRTNNNTSVTAKQQTLSRRSFCLTGRAWPGNFVKRFSELRTITAIWFPQTAKRRRKRRKKEEKTGRPKKCKTKRKIDEYRKTLRSIEAEQQVGHCQSAWCSRQGGVHLDSAVLEQVESASLSGALARKVRVWARDNLKADFLEFVMLSLPIDPCKRLADLVHFAPSDFTVPYFLADVFRREIPQDSFVAWMRSLAAIQNPKELTSAFLGLAEAYPSQVRRQYSYLRNQPHILAQSANAQRLAEIIPLETLLWYFEELFQSSCTCRATLKERLRTEENSLAESLQSNKSKATYGKLVERILTFRRMRLNDIAEDLVGLADRRLVELKELHSSKAKSLRVAVFGDASASMQAAIEAATIFASMVSACLDGELSYFNGKVIKSPHVKPNSVGETLRVCNDIRANSLTSNASVLWPYYSERKVMDLFVMVTDEGENTKFEGYMFADLLAKYKGEVNPNAQLIVVSVGAGNPAFRSSLADKGISYKTVTIDERRADLTKFDGLLGQLASMSSSPPPSSSSSASSASVVMVGSDSESSAPMNLFLVEGDGVLVNIKDKDLHIL